MNVFHSSEGSGTVLPYADRAFRLPIFPASGASFGQQAIEKERIVKKNREAATTSVVRQTAILNRQLKDRKMRVDGGTKYRMTSSYGELLTGRVEA